MIEHTEDSGLNEAVNEVINNKAISDFADLRENKVRILPLLKCKTNKDGDHEPCPGQAAVCKKVSEMHQAAGIEADYILIFDYYVWNHPSGINPKHTLQALIHKALMAIEVVKTDDGLKFKKREPDIVEFTETTRYFGVYTENLGGYLEIMNSASRSAVDALATGDLGDGDGDA